MPSFIGYHDLPKPKLEWSFFELMHEPDFTLVLLVFLIGIMVSLFHRIGVVPQAVGLMAFAMASRSEFMDKWEYLGQTGYYFGPGYFIAILGIFISLFAAKNFWWQRRSHAIVPAISRVAALSPNSTRPAR